MTFRIAAHVVTHLVIGLPSKMRESFADEIPQSLANSAWVSELRSMYSMIGFLFVMGRV